MNFEPKSDFGPKRLAVRWLDSPVIGPLVVGRGKFRRQSMDGASCCTIRLSQRSRAGWGRAVRAFTLLELMMVIAIIGFIAALALPHIGGIGQANSMTTATRQMLDDVGLARQRAMVNNSTVYMVFLPPMFWTNYQGDYISGPQVSNLVAHQYSAYALVSLSSVGDQPGQHHARFLTDWRFLPNGVFIAPFEFTNITTNISIYTTNTLSGIINSNLIQPWSMVTVPFPSLYSQNSAIPLPCIAFTPQGSLATRFADQYIALTRGSVFYPTDTNGTPVLEAPNWAENPPGNDMKNPNLIQIDWMTARATLLQNQFQ